MQRGKSVVDSFPESVDRNQGSISSNTGMNQTTVWNNMLNPVESRFSNYTLSSDKEDYTGADAVSQNAQSFSGWNLVESSANVNLQNQGFGDGFRMEHGRSSSFSACAGVNTRLEEMQFGPSSVPFRENVNSGPFAHQVAGTQLTMQSSISNNSNRNANSNVGYMDIGLGWQAMGAVASPNLSKSSALEKDNISPASSSSGDIGTSSGTSGYLVKNDIESGPSLGTWGLSSKRKALEGTSGQSYPGGSSSCFPQVENIVRHSIPARYNASNSLSISSSPMNGRSINPSEQLTCVVSDVFPPLSVPGIAENSPRNFGARLNRGHRDFVQFNAPLTEDAPRHSNICSSHQPSRPFSFTDSVDFRSKTSVTTSSSNPANQSQSTHVPGLSGDRLPWSRGRNSRGGSSSSSLMISGGRGALQHDEANFRSTQRNNAEHPMYVPPTEMRNLVQEPTSWSLTTGNSSNSGGVPSSSQVGPSSSVCPLPSPWVPQHSLPSQNQERLSDLASWTLFPPVDSESGGQTGHTVPLPSASSLWEMPMSSGVNNNGRHSPHPRSALSMEVPGDDVGSWRVLAAGMHGRQRLVTEIRQVLNAMRRGENLRDEDHVLFDSFTNGFAELHDRHRDMRLDVDNMSYEELLALEERIGDVNTGLSEESILKVMQQQKYLPVGKIYGSNLEPCCICREEYCVDDDIGTLNCGHDFHTGCIKQWLTQKNLCPICKVTALETG